MYGLILTLHILISLMLIVVVLIQMGKGGAMGGIFGGGGSAEALFSAPSGNVFIKKLTVGLTIAFFCTTVFLTILNSRRTTRSVIQRVPIQQAQ
jgi:preprotein translocase subunit SecG